MTTRPRRGIPSILWHLTILGLVVAADLARPSPARARAPGSSKRQLIVKGDRIAIVGSSSTQIGIWPRTLEFLLRTRHPELELEFRSFTTGAGSFQTGLTHLDAWLREYHPTVVFFNYGVNESIMGREGLPHFKETMAGCVARAEALGARVVLLTPQAADARKAGAKSAALRTLYAETMLSFGRERGWTVIDIHHPLDTMQKANRAIDPRYSILHDWVHLTYPAYVGWGFLLYDRLDLPFVRSSSTLTAAGNVTDTENCAIRDVEASDGTLSFLRVDRVMPILPPGPLPPRFCAPIEAHSRYLLAVTGLPPGTYEIRCEGQAIGIVDSSVLAVGVNLNSLLLDAKAPAPWSLLAGQFWLHQNLQRIGQTPWRFVIKKQ